jgi:protein TonB
MKTEPARSLFISSGCLTMESLKKYAAGTLNPEDYLLVKGHIESCPFCTDAIDGLRTEKNHEEFERAVNSLKAEIGLKITKGNENIKLSGHQDKRRQIYLYLAIAASLIVLAGLYSLFHFYPSIRDNIKQTRVAENRPSPLTGKKDTVSANPQSQVSTIMNRSSSKIKVKTTLKAKKYREKYNAGKSSALMLRQITLPTAALNRKGNQDSTISVLEENPKAEESLSMAGAGGEKKAEVQNEDVMINKMSYAPRSRKIAIQGAKSAEGDESVFFIVDEMPKFRGKGIEEFEKYISENLVYPQKAIEEKLEGIVTASFVIDTIGNLVEVEIIRGVDPVLDHEAIRVIKASPNWKPGKQGGKVVRVKLTVPVRFRIN